MKTLIANRGEIAVRLIQAVQETGARAVAVYSDPDRSAPHVLAADEAFALTGQTSADTYLRGDKIIDIARSCGAEAIHPGYGFLAENADFAQACADAGLTFIGPAPEVIRAMGDKIVAKRTMAEAGVPVVPGWSGEGAVDAKALAAGAERIGYPVLVKAAAGGGGKGMRIVESADGLEGGVAAARREAGAAFGDARVFLEKYLSDARHVEVQIFGDTHGQVVHLFERDCSIQRRHQKIVEESPAPGLSADLRQAMGDAAVRAADAIGYTSAGTVEFLLAPSGEFYFLEVNTRLQVEHPVTELVTGHDLVKTQLTVAAGEPLPFTQADLTQTGHAIECRICAEDPSRDFFPSTGTIAQYAAPSGAGIRVDSGIAAGSTVEVFYDPLLAKLIVWGRDRGEALARMRRALANTVILGIETNIDFLQDLLAHPDVQAGGVDTRFLARHTIGADREIPMTAVAAAAMALNAPATSPDAHPNRPASNPWSSAGPWRAI